jgi:hypothetical protein
MTPRQTARAPRGFPRVVATALAMATFAPLLLAEEQRTYLLDPFTQATAGYAGCPEAKPPVMTEQEMRTTAHQRVERGTSCCLAGTCECGGAYKRDPEINERVAKTVREDRRLRDTSVWVTTTRKFVTLQGCVRSRAQKSALERMVKHVPDVAIVWNETTVGTKPAAKKP